MVHPGAGGACLGSRLRERLGFPPDGSLAHAPFHRASPAFTPAQWRRGLALEYPTLGRLRIAPHSQDDPRIRAALKAREPPATDSMLPGVARFSMGVAVRDGAARTRKGGHGRTRKSSPAARIYYSAAVNDRSNGGATRPGGRAASSTARRLESTTPPARGQGVIVKPRLCALPPRRFWAGNVPSPPPFFLPPIPRDRQRSSPVRADDARSSAMKRRSRRPYPSQRYGPAHKAMRARLAPVVATGTVKVLSL